MDKLKNPKNRPYVIAGAVILGSSLLTGIYFLYKKLTKLKLNQWLEEYFDEIQQKIKLLNGEPLSIEIIAYIHHLLKEIQDYLVQKNYPDLEEERIELLNHHKEYEAAIFDTMEAQEGYYRKATKLIEQKLGVKFEDIQKVMQNADRKELGKCMEACRKPYYDVPKVDKELVKKAYLQYVDGTKKQMYLSQQQLALMSQNPEYQETAMKIIFTNKYLIQDSLKKKYGIDEKYLSQLVREHNLLDDEQIKEAHNQLLDLEKNSF
jgi:hypothetical protein